MLEIQNNSHTKTETPTTQIVTTLADAVHKITTTSQATLSSLDTTIVGTLKSEATQTSGDPKTKEVSQPILIQQTDSTHNTKEQEFKVAASFHQDKIDDAILEKRLINELNAAYKSCIENVNPNEKLNVEINGNAFKVSVITIFGDAQGLLIKAVEVYFKNSKKGIVVSNFFCNIIVGMIKDGSVASPYLSAKLTAVEDILKIAQQTCTLLVDVLKEHLITGHLTSIIDITNYNFHALICSKGSPTHLSYLISAVMFDNISAIRRSIKLNPALLQQKGVGGLTVLDIAVYSGHFNVAEELIKHKVTLSNPLRVLIYTKDEKIIGLLQKHHLLSEEACKFRIDASNMVAKDLTPSPLPQQKKPIREHYEQFSADLKTMYSAAIQYSIKREEGAEWHPSVIPKEATRVTSTTDDSFYFNASWLQKDKLLLSINPREMEIPFFWQLVLERKVFTIINLTDIGFQSSFDPCSRYWPLSGLKISFKNYFVKLESEVVQPEFVLRRFCIYENSNPDTPIHRLIQRHHPVSDGLGIEPELAMLLYQQCQDEVTLIHCVAGVGRTGALAGCFVGFDEISKGKNPQPVEIVNKMRENRDGLVQTSSQLYSIWAAFQAFKESYPK